MKVVHNTKYVSFGPRVIATLIDSLIWTLPILFIVGRWAQVSSVEDLLVSIITDTIRFLVPLSILRSFYAPWMTSRWKATLGKMAIGAEVANAEKKALTFKRAAFREWVAKYINYSLFGVSFLTILFNAKHQGIHDQLSGTFVYSKKPQLVTGLIVLAALLAIVGWWSWTIVQAFMNNGSLSQNIAGVFLLR